MEISRAATVFMEIVGGAALITADDTLDPEAKAAYALSIYQLTIGCVQRAYTHTHTRKLRKLLGSGRRKPSAHARSRSCRKHRSHSASSGCA